MARREPDWSLGEIRTLCIKAARGAGLSWGLGEEAGWAVQWLEARGYAGAERFADYLQFRLSSAPFDEACCPIRFGAAVSDFDTPEPLLPTTISAPILAVPFLSRINWSGTIQAGNAGIECDAGKLHLSAMDGQMGCSPVRCRIGEVQNVRSDEVQDPHCNRVPFERAGSIAALESIAHLTYAPATEESRRRGAGEQ